MKYYYFLFLSALTAIAHAQVVPVQGRKLNPIDQSIFRQWSSEVDQQVANKAIEGTPFLFDDWVKGELVTIKGKKHSDVDLKLNLYTNQLIYRNPFTGDSTLIMSKFLSYYKLQSADTTLSFYHVPKLADDGYKIKPEDFYLVLLEGKYSLLGRPEVKLKRATKNSMINADGEIKDKFVHSNEFFLRDKDGKVFRVKSTKQAFAKSLPEYNEEIKSYIKKNRYDLTDPIDLIAIMDYYNLLVK